MAPEPPNVPGYTFVAYKDVNEVCEFIYEDDRIVGPIKGAEYGTICLGVGAVATATAFVTLGPAASAVVGIPAAICYAGDATCEVREIIEKSTSCDDILAYVYLADDLQAPTYKQPVIVLPACRNGAINATANDVANTAEDIGSEAVETVQNFADGVEEDINDAIDDLQKDPLGSLGDGLTEDNPAQN